jgi:heptosyltransferase-2
MRIRRHAYTTVEPRGQFEDGRYVPRSAVASGLSLARHAGVAGARDALPEIPVAAETVARARDAFIHAGVPAGAIDERRLVGINPGRPYPAKEWPARRFVELAREMVARGRHVVVMWGPGEERVASAIATESGQGVTLAPGFGLETLGGALRCLALLVTIDSGLKHLAVCVRVPTVSIFGSTDPREWHMGVEHDRCLWRGLSCSPCRRLTCPFGAPCMDIAPDPVIDEVETVMEGLG